MISPEKRQEKDIISFTYVLFIGTNMPIKNIIKPINNNIIFSIYYINFVMYFIIYAKILKNIVITKSINNCYIFLSISSLYNSSMNKLIKKAIGRYIIQNNMECILRFRKYNNTHVNIIYNKILNVIIIVFILFFFYAKIYKNIILSK